MTEGELTDERGKAMQELRESSNTVGLREDREKREEGEERSKVIEREDGEIVAYKCIRYNMAISPVKLAKIFLFLSCFLSVHYNRRPDYEIT